MLGTDKIFFDWVLTNVRTYEVMSKNNGTNYYRIWAVQFCWLKSKIRSIAENSISYAEVDNNIVLHM